MKESELKIESLCEPSRGGQTVGVVHAGVRVTHVPTGIVVECETERSQMKNKRICLSMIEWGLAEIDYPTDL